MQAPLHLNRLPILYYTITHNVTKSGSVEVINTTNLEITLKGITTFGKKFLITVHAINAAGSGVISSDVCEFTMTGLVMLHAHAMHYIT